MHISHYKLSRLIVTFSMFLVIIIPSFKFFVFSSLVNVISVALLLFTVVFSYRFIVLNNIQLFMFYLMSIFFIFLLSSGWNIDASVSVLNGFRYISLIVTIFSIIILCDLLVLPVFNGFILLWSIFLSLMYLIGGISPSGAGELSYLILSMQVAIGYVISVSYLVSRKDNFLLWLALTIFLLLIVLSLAGRMSILGSTLVAVISFIVYLRLNWKSNKLLVVFVTAFISFLLGYLLFSFSEYIFNDYFLYKMTMMFEGNDGRSSTYITSINIIAENPFGIGLEKYNSEIGFYPHNIFLEVGLNSGILAMFVLVVIVTFWAFLFTRFIFFSSVEPFVLAVGMLAFYLFLSWNTSNDLGSS